MSAALSQPDEGAACLVPGRFSLPRTALFLVGAAVLAVPVALLAEVLQTDLRFAPLLLFPILTGIGLAALLIGLMRFGQVGHRPTLVAGTLLAAALVVVGQHYLIYVGARNLIEEQAREYAKHVQTMKGSFPDLVAPPPTPPVDFATYLQVEAAQGRPLWGDTRVCDGWAWASWGIDGLLLAAAALAMVVPAMRLPYCNGCQTWLRTIRSGRVPGPVVVRMAAVANVSVERHPVKTGRYRLLCCRRGCGLNGLDLVWEDEAGKVYSAEAWLRPKQRNQIMQIADDAGSPTENDEETD